jgi:hypothetical protein
MAVDSYHPNAATYHHALGLLFAQPPFSTHMHQPSRAAPAPMIAAKRAALPTKSLYIPKSKKALPPSFEPAPPAAPAPPIPMSEWHLNQALRIRRALFGNLHVETLATLSALANLLWDRSQWAESEKHWSCLLNAKAQTVGADHPDYAAAQRALRAVQAHQPRVHTPDAKAAASKPSQPLTFGGSAASTLSNSFSGGGEVVPTDVRASFYAEMEAPGWGALPPARNDPILKQLQALDEPYPAPPSKPFQANKK